MMTVDKIIDVHALQFSSLSKMFPFVAVIALLAAPERAGATPESIPLLIRQLGSGDYHRRAGATTALKAAGERALPELRQAIGSPDPEIRFRLRRLIRAIMIASGKSRTAGMTLALIDPGKFLMGSSPRESGRRPDETQHRVRISVPFLMGRYEVTQDEYRKVMKSQPSWFSTTGGGKDKVKSLNTGRFPVDNVSWFDAIAFCNTLSKLDGYSPYYELTEVKRGGTSIAAAKVVVIGGNGYRLPTESEWEYACRAGSLSPYHFGNGSNGKLANVKGIRYTGYGGRSIGPNLKRTTTVGSYKPNAFDLYDMHGNVAEWCWDWYTRNYLAGDDVRDPRGPESGHHRVLRGGSWLVTEGSTRSASRLFHIPKERKFYTGFRVARTP